MTVTLIKSELFKQGGLEKYTWQLAQDFCALDVSVRVLTSGAVQPPFSHPRLSIVSLPVAHSLSFLNVLHFDRTCKAYLEQHPTPIVFSLDRNRFQTHIRAGNGVHAAYLVHRSQEEGLLKRASFALNPLHRAILSLEKKGFEHPGLKLLFTNSSMVKQEILRFYAVDPGKVAVVHNGVEWHGMQKSFDAWEAGKQSAIQNLGLAPSAFQFLFIGHNFQRKGLEKLLKALALIKEEHFQLSVVGKEKHLGRFQELAKSLGLAKKVFFWGPQKEAIPFYQLADCAVIPSLYDPFANVTIEALAMGVPVVSSRNNGGSEILNPTSGCIIESLDDAKTFSQVLHNRLAKPKTQGSAKAIRASVEHLDFSKQLRRMTEAVLGLSL